MTREQARRALEGAWCFKEMDSMIALRDVELIQAVEDYEASRWHFGNRDLTPRSQAPHAWRNT